MKCICCDGPFKEPGEGPLCTRCRILEGNFREFSGANPKAAYTWAMQKALDLAGDITGVKPGDSFLEVENGELGIRTVNKVKTTIARDVPPELRTNEKETE